jgi:O-antigen/teichoic acid export membrane protein
MLALLHKYFHQPQPVKAAFWFTVCNIIPKGISLFTAPIYIRLLTTEQYGLSSIYGTWHGILSIFATLYLEAGVFSVGMVQYDNDRDTYASAMQGLSTTITAILFVGYILFREKINSIINLPTILMLLMFAQCFFSPAYGFWSNRQRFEYKYHALIAVMLFMMILSPVIAIVCIQRTIHKGEAFVVGIFGTQVVFFISFYIRNFLKGKRYFNKEYWKFALKFNLPLIPHYLSYIVLGQVDRIMIDRIVGRGQTGIYSLAYNFSFAISVVVNGINASFSPWILQALKAKRYINIKKTSNILTVFFAVIALMFIAVAPEIIYIITTPAYYEAIWIIPPVTISAYLIFVFSMPGGLLFYFAETRFIMIASTVGALCNIILNFLCIKRYGYLAAGYTTFISYGVITVAYYLSMFKVCQKHDMATIQALNIHFIVFTTLVLLLLSSVFMVFYNLPFIRYIIILIGICASLIKRKMIVNAFKHIKANQDKIIL